MCDEACGASWKLLHNFIFSLSALIERFASNQHTHTHTACADTRLCLNLNLNTQNDKWGQRSRPLTADTWELSC